MEELETSVTESAEPSTDSAPAEVASPAEDSGSTNGEGQASTASESESNQPFHTHPRFQELISQKNELSAKLAEMQATYQKQAYEQQMQVQQLMQRLPKEKPEVNPMHEKLKAIDPEFAEYLQKLEKKAESTSMLEQRMQQYEQFMHQREIESLQSSYDSKMNSLHGQYKVPDQMRGFIQTQVENAIHLNPKLTVKDLDQVYKSAHEATNKVFEDFKRAQLQSYVTNKKQDAAPATQTGGTPATNKPPKVAMTREDVVKQIAKEIRASKQVI